MDTTEQLGSSASESAGKYLAISALCLTLYDYMLLFDDEIQYIWKGRKTWIFYLYIVNRPLLLAYQVWRIFYSVHGEDRGSPGFYIRILALALFLFCSDIFITLRVYAVTLGDKIFVSYFMGLALVRLGASLGTGFTISASTPKALLIKLIPNVIGTAFDLSAFLVIMWYTFREHRMFKFSVMVRTLVTEATVYFMVMVAAQLYLQASYNRPKSLQHSFLAYGIFNPIFTLRFVISLRKAADPEGGQKWELRHFGTSLDARAPTDLEREDTESSVDSFPQPRAQGQRRVMD